MAFGPALGRRALLAGLGASGLFPAGAREAAGASVGRRAAADYLSRPDFMRYDVEAVRAVHYAEVAAALGVLGLAAALRDREMESALLARFRRMREAGLPNSANHVDANVYGALLLELARRTGERGALAEGLALADGQWRSTDADGLTRQARWWIDDVWMIGRLQVAGWHATGEDRFLDRAGLMARLYLARLQQPNGLFHHGPQAPYFWGRGNGWVAAGLAEILSVLPPAHRDFAPVLLGFRRMMAALLRLQAPDGMWRQLIDRPDAWKESSATAMFAFAFARGRRRGLLDDPARARAAGRAWRALAARVGADGRLAGICVGTGQSADAAYYLARPTVTGDLHGQAALLWLAAESLPDPGRIRR